MKTNQWMTLLAVTAAAQIGFAKTEVSDQLERLKTNQENSEHNLKQYETNQKIVEQNLSEVNVSVEQLKTNKAHVKKSQKSAAENEKVIDKAVGDIKVEVDKEKKLMSDEQLKLAEVEKLAEKLRANLALREQNIATYNARVQELQQTKATLGEREKAVADLDQALEVKYQQAMNEHKEWSGKQKAYADEVAKWKKNRNDSEQMHKNFDRLKN